MAQAKAAFYEDFGNHDDVKIDNIELPDIGEGELLVNIRAAGVNPVDASVVQGHLNNAIPHEFPIIPGWDMSGVIEDRGFAARRFDIGDEIYAYARRPFVQWGTFSEYTVIPECYLSRKPDTVSHEEAAAIPLVGLTAYQSLYEAGNLQENQTVLILGASGGVGSIGIQLAKVKNANVIGVSSKENHEFMNDLGADTTIDYKNEDIGEALKEIEPEGVDLIFDCASGETLQQSLTALKENGKLVSILNSGENLEPGIDFEYVFVEPNSRQLDHLRDLIETEQIEVPVTNRYTLGQAAAALEQIQTLHTTGKIVISP